jgi:prevent-host-death family protein
MEHRVSLREANQQLARYVKTVEGGDEVVITRRGKPVARLVAIGAKRRLTAQQRAAWQRTLERMSRGFSLGGRMPSRDELHVR